MTQPIAIDLSLIKKVAAEFEDYNTLRQFLNMTELLRLYHSIQVDYHKNTSHWVDQFFEIVDSLGNQNIKKAIDDLMIRSDQKYTSTEFTEITNLLNDLAQSTPDKLALKSKSGIDGEIRFYSPEEFYSENPDINCRLFRPYKRITVEPDQSFSTKVIFAPYLRCTKKIEFVDKYIFNTSVLATSQNFIVSIIKLCPSVTEIILCSGRDADETLKNSICKYLSSVLEDKISITINDYNALRNHDRFLIINDTEFSIRFSTSFNNLVKKGEDTFEAIKSFEITISRDRKYFN